MTIMPDQKVNLFVLGFQKCGTTSLAKYLSRNKKIHVPTIKEVQYFSHDEYFGIGNDYLHSFFPKSKAATDYWCDASPHYIASTKAVERIAAYNPAARYIILVRDPYDRMISHYKMIRSRDPSIASLSELVERDLSQVTRHGLAPELSMSGEFVQNSLFGAQLKRALAILPESANILVLPQRSLADLPAVTEAISGFLGVDIPAQHFEGRFNASKGETVSLFESAIRKFPKLKSLGSLFSPSTRRTISRTLRFTTEVKSTTKNKDEMPADLLTSECLDAVKSLFEADEKLLKSMIETGNVKSIEELAADCPQVPSC